MAIFSKIKNNCVGATAIEYAVIASCLSVVILGAMIVISQRNDDNYSGVATKVSKAIDKSQKP